MPPGGPGGIRYFFFSATCGQAARQFG